MLEYFEILEINKNGFVINDIKGTVRRINENAVESGMLIKQIIPVEKGYLVLFG